MAANITNRDLEQHKVWKAWKENNYRGTYIGTTGVGKTKIGVMPVGDWLSTGIISNALIVTPTTNLRDNEWPNEFDKWGYKKIKNKVTFECINTACKRSGEEWDILILDEVHTSLSIEYRKLLTDNKFKRILCLSATVHDIEKLEFLESIAPIIHKTSIEKALNLGLVSPFEVYNIPVDIIESEFNKYMNSNIIIDNYFPYFNRNIKLLIQCAKSPSFFKKYCEEKFLDYRFFVNVALDCLSAINNRRLILCNLSSKHRIVYNILTLFNTKAIVFSESISFCDNQISLIKHFNHAIKALDLKSIKPLLGDVVIYNSSKSKKENRLSIEKFRKESDCNTIFAVKALNAGFNIPSCNLGIIASGNSTSLDFLQRLGRIIRHEPNKKAIFINLYFKGHIDSSGVFIKSPEMKWVEKRCNGIPNVHWINDISEIKELYEYNRDYREREIIDSVFDK